MKNKKLWMITGIVVTVLIVVGISYAYWLNVFVQKDDNVVITDCFKMSFVEDSSSNISLEQGYPISDEEGALLKPYKFSIQNICTSTNSYQINIESMKESTMPDRVIKAKLNDSDGILLRSEVDPVVGEHAYKLEEGIIYPNETKSYELRIWMDESTTMADTDAMNKEFIGKVTITASYTKEEYKDYVLNGVDPILKEGLIPVTIDNDGVVRKADTTSPWYSYENKQWANAVILNDETKVYRNHEEIPEENIESYFVWIPKYRYQLWDLGEYEGHTTIDATKVHEIPIIFGDYDTQDNVNGECSTPMESGESGNCRVGDYMTHPAFISMNTRGLWVGKFETGYKGSTDKVSAEVNATEPEKVQIKPNVNSWRNIQVANAFSTSYNYKRELDSHMMKNTEWGAVAYLSHSKYGSMSSVRINNNSNFLTGYSAVNEPTCGYTATNEECNRYGTTDDITKSWNTEIGYLASTTGNITGVYDMSGGIQENLMGVMVDKAGKPMSGRNSKANSGFNGTFGCPTCDGDTSGLTELTTGVNFPESKYYDRYNYLNNDLGFKKRILGDATGEMGPFKSVYFASFERPIGSWHQDSGLSLWVNDPWVKRGWNFDMGVEAGVFAFSNTMSVADSYSTYRVVLSM
ncbi:MAG: hypothetical protein HFI09_04775 [Bacilli bacterium]|nr:hypothetical protein [Bacilli bacterium]